MQALAAYWARARSDPSARAHHAWCAGVEKIYDLGTLSDYEKAGVKALIPELTSSIQKGVDFCKSA